MHTENGSNEVGTFLSVLEKGCLEELRSWWPAQCVVSVRRRTCRKRNSVNRREGSFTRQRSTISLKAREYLCTPPSRSRVGGAASTLSVNDGQIEFGKEGKIGPRIEDRPRIDGS